MRAPHRHRVGRLAAWAAILNRQQAQSTIGAFARNRVMATLAVDGIWRGQLSAGLADVEQRATRPGGGAIAVHRDTCAAAPERIMAIISAGHRPGGCGIAASGERVALRP